MPRRLRPATLALLGGAVLWACAALALWDATQLPSLDLPQLGPHRYFTDSFLERSADYELFLGFLGLIGSIVLVTVLVLYAWHGPRLVRESAAGRVGTGMLLAMLGFAVVWLAEVPFDLLGLWWQRRHDVSHEGYLRHLLFGFIGLGGTFVFLCLGIGIMMGLAGVMRRWWWLAAVPAFVALGLLSAFLGPYLIPGTEPLHKPVLQQEARALERIEGTDESRLRVQEVHEFTDAPNAETVGLGPSTTIVLWDTLLDHDFSRAEIRFVVAHEIGHVAHDDVLKRVGWLALVLLPALGLTAYLTRGRGGLAQPAAIPVAILVLTVTQLLAAPLLNTAFRREEAAADWAALEATHEPAAATSSFRRLATKSLSDPGPPFWIDALYGNHPTMMERIAMAEAWEEERGR
jgi:STE24 endopeptidase